MYKLAAKLLSIWCAGSVGYKNMEIAMRLHDVSIMGWHTGGEDCKTRLGWMTCKEEWITKNSKQWYADL